MSRSERALRVEQAIRRMYTASDDLPYHNLGHILFVSRRTLDFAPEFGADIELAEVAALTHDLNYLVDRRSSASEGDGLRRSCLADAGFSEAEIDQIEEIVVSASSKHHGEGISPEAQALADADMLFKALPSTPLLFARDYLEEGGRSLLEMAHELVDRQRPLLSEGRYFYSGEAQRRYARWAEVNVRLWENLLEALRDPDIAELVALRLDADVDER